MVTEGRGEGGRVKGGYCGEKKDVEAHDSR